MSGREREGALTTPRGSNLEEEKLTRGSSWSGG
jgi:hypothetical protein